MNIFELGWAAFPCNGKIPATPNGFKNAVKTESEYQDLVKKYPGANIGIATGAFSNIFVLDVDVKHDAGGDKTLKGLVDKYGELPKTVEASTWSGGRHYYFNIPSYGIGCRTNFLPGLDIRGTGGYVVAPPSIVEGKPYAWINEPGTLPVADAPEWLLGILKDKVAQPAMSDGLILSGNRNQELTRRAGKMRNAGMELSDIYMSLLKINAAKCSPPLPEKEVRTISESVAKYEAGNTNAALTDMWNAERFVEKCGNNIKWCDKLGGWFTWDGTAWRPSDKNSLIGMAKGFVKCLGVQAEASGDKKLKTHATRSESSHSLSSIIELAKSESGVMVELKDFDKDNNLLNCSNGTLNLDTGEIYESKREDMITKAIDVAYNPSADCPYWENFLNDIMQGDPGMITYIKRAIGYCLSGYTTEQKFFMCVGNGRNGKSTFLKHIMYILAPSYSSSTPAATMLENDGNTLNAIASLKGTRLVVLNEFDEGKTLSAAQVKNLTGGEPVVARFLYHEQFVYTPTYKFWLTTNFKPRIKDTSLGIWRRLVVLPFDYTVPVDKIDTGLDAKLVAEYQGILNWAIEGYKEWKEYGLPNLEKLTKVAGVYQSDSDMIGQFLADCLDDESTELAETSVVDFMRSFQEWANENGIRHYPGRNTIIDYMEKKGYGRPIRNNGAILRGKLAWRGISIRKTA